MFLYQPIQVKQYILPWLGTVPRSVATKPSQDIVSYYIYIILSQFVHMPILLCQSIVYPSQINVMHWSYVFLALTHQFNDVTALTTEWFRIDA